MPILAELNKCTGCTACTNICTHNAIQMIEDNEGFLIPSVDSSKCVNCNLCEQICPVTNSKLKIGTDNPKTFAMWSTNDRIVSSSGGAFSAFARYIIDKGGVIFGAVYDQDFNLIHTNTSCIEGLEPMRGSKYMQSSVGMTYREVKESLLSDKYVLFCGTPCQIAGLRSYLRKEYEKLLTLDLVCHGVPSNKIFKSYLNKLKSKIHIDKDEQVINYEFRRRNGWGFSPSISTNKCTKKKLYDVDALYMEAFNASAIFRKCCYTCCYSSIPRVGDCTIADFWGIGRYGTPFKHNVMKGVSLVLANTSKGQSIISELHDCFIEERTLDEALIENHNLRKVSHIHPKRDEIIASFLDPERTLESIDKEYHLIDHSVKAYIKKMSDKTGVFTITKTIYNWYKAH